MGCNPLFNKQPSVTIINNQIGGYGNPVNKQNSNTPKTKKGESKSQNINVNSQYFHQNDNALDDAIEKTVEPKEKIELFFSLIENNSTSDDIYGLSVSLLTKGNTSLSSIGSTNNQQGGIEIIDFDKTFIVDYYFEMKQTMSVSLIINNHSVKKMETSIGKIMGSKAQTYIQEIEVNEFKAKLQIMGIPVKTDNRELKLNVIADFRKGIYQPFFLIKRSRGSGLKDKIDWINAYKSEVLKSYPIVNQFSTIQLSTQVLCNGDMSKQILIEFSDYTSQKVIGTHCCSVEELITNNKSISITEPNGKTTKDNTFQVQTQVTKKYKFLDYIRGGLQISMIVGIDFTGSNGNPHIENSLHSIALNPNLYEKAIESCCSVVAFYDADQQFPVFGYGAILKSSPKVNHCFNLNNEKDPNIFTVDSILKIYRNFITDVELYGPAFFGPLIKQSIHYAKEAEKNGDYCILMILTDGIINDMQDTVDAIVEASHLPISIIIIGIGYGGDDGFSEMDFLDGDDTPLVNSKNQHCARDIVQFVEFTKFDNNPTLLAEKVLEEVPKQLEGYYKLINKPPGDPIIF